MSTKQFYTKGGNGLHIIEVDKNTTTEYSLKTATRIDITGAVEVTVEDNRNDTNIRADGRDFFTDTSLEDKTGTIKIFGSNDDLAMALEGFIGETEETITGDLESGSITKRKLYQDKNASSAEVMIGFRALQFSTEQGDRSIRHRIDRYYSCTVTSISDAGFTHVDGADIPTIEIGFKASNRADNSRYLERVVYASDGTIENNELLYKKSNEELNSTLIV